MADLISRAAAIKAFTGKPPEYYHTSYIVGELNCVTAVDAAPVIHAHWSFKGTAYGCSNCGHGAIIPGANYCEECGAKMDEALYDGMSVKGIAPDKVEVVRCKDCKHWNECDDKTSGTCNNVGGLWDAWEFCSDGERRDSE